MGYSQAALSPHHMLRITKSQGTTHPEAEESDTECGELDSKPSRSENLSEKAKSSLEIYIAIHE